MKASIFHIFLVVLPLIFLVIFLVLRHKRLSRPRLLFYFFSGITGILVMLIPGIGAIRDSASEPSLAVWAVLMTLCFSGMGLAMGTAHLIMRYLWLDE